MEPGAPVDLLTNPDYVLVHRKYEGALRSTGSQLQLVPVVVTDAARQLTWRHYLEARIRHQASRDEIQHACPADPVMCPADPVIRRAGPENDVFVSDELQNRLQLVESQRLGFSPGSALFVQ